MFIVSLLYRQEGERKHSPRVLSRHLDLKRDSTSQYIYKGDLSSATRNVMLTYFLGHKLKWGHNPFFQEMDGEKPERCKDTEAGMKKGKQWYLFPFFSRRYPNYLPEGNFNIFSKPNYIEIKKKKKLKNPAIKHN